MTLNEQWKQEHANASELAVNHELVTGVIGEFMSNIGIPDTGLPAYGVRKVAMYAAQVARAQLLGIDPNLLRLTPDEADSRQWELAAAAVYLGLPVHMIQGGQA